MLWVLLPRSRPRPELDDRQGGQIAVHVLAMWSNGSQEKFENLIYRLPNSKQANPPVTRVSRHILNTLCYDSSRTSAI